MLRVPVMRRSRYEARQCDSEVLSAASINATCTKCGILGDPVHASSRSSSCKESRFFNDWLAMQDKYVR